MATSRILRLAYRLRCHYVGAWSLDRWSITLATGAVLAILLRWLIRRMPALTARDVALVAALLAIAGLLLWLRRWAASRDYVVFEPQSGLLQPPGLPLDPQDKVLIRAFGRFEVMNRSRFFADLLAYWRTFASREHAVMAIVHESRFLGLGQMPEEDVGMWYIFCRLETIETIIPGLLIFGRARSLALQVVYLNTPPASTEDGRRSSRRNAQPVAQTAYLVFDDEGSRTRVWADLLADDCVARLILQPQLSC